MDVCGPEGFRNTLKVQRKTDVILFFGESGGTGYERL